jgi:hypothetical protein
LLQSSVAAHVDATYALFDSVPTRHDVWVIAPASTSKVHAGGYVFAGRELQFAVSQFV